MNITVKEILQHEPFRPYTPVAGLTGLTNEVRHVSVYETEPDQNNEVFPRAKVFYLTSLYYQKDSTEAMLHYLQTICDLKASGLCVIDDYIQTFPEEVLRFCDEHALPLLLVNHNIPYADMISAVMEQIILAQQKKITENKLKLLESSSLSPTESMETIRDLNPHFRPQLTTFYLLAADSRTFDAGAASAFIEKINETPSHFACHYKKGILLLCSHPEIGALRYENLVSGIITQIETLLPGGIIGISEDLLLEDCGKSISQAITAVQIFRRESAPDSHNLIYYRDLGLYKLLVSFLGSNALRQFYEETVQQILDYDLQYRSHLFSTLEIFLKNDCSYTAAAKEMFVHENTIRYRMERIKEVLDFRGSDMDLFHTLDVACKIHRLKIASL